MVKLLIVLSFAWPVTLTAAATSRIAEAAPAFSGLVYLAASRVCHQMPYRSFRTAQVQWPVCARCSGLYLAAPIGAVAAMTSLRRRRRPGPVLSERQRVEGPSLVPWIVAAAVPTALTLACEWLHLVPISNLARAIAALPLGAMVAYAVVRMAGPSRQVG